MGFVDYYFWMGSEWTLIGADRLEAVALRHGVKIRYYPIDLPIVCARTGGALPAEWPRERQAYRVADLKRWCARLGLPLNPTPKYLWRDVHLASRLVVAAIRLGLDTYSIYRAILQAQWCEDQDISDEATLRSILHELRLDDDQLIRDASSPTAKQIFTEYTERAIAAGVFDVPTYALRGELFHGQDRLEFLDEALSEARAMRDISSPSRDFNPQTT
ncbi:2-hydroxychromene-2-carboxylate isomerase [Variovorax sp. LjRoot178]|uniref:2-hydroxychromene-2-carboxylate isomerase n=1 Tax=Variovorax sp. LjRoot178 TaxID=3342277 RepID=UPI003ECDBD63